MILVIADLCIIIQFHPTLADEAATVRVTNLSEDTQESDLQELFRPFGSIARIYLAKDKTTNQSKVGLCHPKFIFFDFLILLASQTRSPNSGFLLVLVS